MQPFLLFFLFYSTPFSFFFSFYAFANASLLLVLALPLVVGVVAALTFFASVTMLLIANCIAGIAGSTGMVNNALNAAIFL